MKTARRTRSGQSAKVEDTSLTTFSSDLLTPEEERELLTSFWDCKSELVRVLSLAPQRGPARVVEGAQHARHVAQRRALGAALLEGARRLALEVDDDEVVARDQYLPEVVIAVKARAHARLRLYL